MAMKRALMLAGLAAFAAFATTHLPWGAKSQQSVAATKNPIVKPGDVVWHSDFEAACRASQQSGKPVLLFQLLGKLDEEFC